MISKHQYIKNWCENTSQGLDSPNNRQSSASKNPEYLTQTKGSSQNSVTIVDELPTLENHPSSRRMLHSKRRSQSGYRSSVVRGRTVDLPLKSTRIGLTKPKNLKVDGSLTSDLLSYFEQQSARDVQVVCRGKGHQNLVELHDAQPYIVEAFLECVHTDNCSFFRRQSIIESEHYLNDLLELFLLADRYEFLSLLKKCTIHIAKAINRSNVMEIFTKIENTTDCHELKLKCMEILQKINGADLLTTIRGYDVWQQLRTMVVTFLILGNNPDRSKNKRGTFDLICCAHDSIETVKNQILLKMAHRQAQKDEKKSLGCQRFFTGYKHYRDHVATRSFLKLVYNGTLLENSRTLSECGIVEGSTIFVLDGCTIAPSRLHIETSGLINNRTPTSLCNVSPVAKDKVSILPNSGSTTIQTDQQASLLLSTNRFPPLSEDTNEPEIWAASRLPATTIPHTAPTSPFSELQSFLADLSSTPLRNESMEGTETASVTNETTTSLKGLSAATSESTSPSTGVIRLFSTERNRRCFTGYQKSGVASSSLTGESSSS